MAPMKEAATYAFLRKSLLSSCIRPEEKSKSLDKKDRIYLKSDRSLFFLKGSTDFVNKERHRSFFLPSQRNNFDHRRQRCVFFGPKKEVLLQLSKFGVCGDAFPGTRDTRAGKWSELSSCLVLGMMTYIA